VPAVWGVGIAQQGLDLLSDSALAAMSTDTQKVLTALHH
jgi:hypothetical protein